MGGNVDRLRVAVDEARARWESELATLNAMIAMDVAAETPQPELVEEQRKTVEAAQGVFNEAANAYLRALGGRGQ